MKRLIYQVCVGEQQNSKLYQHCLESVRVYCEKHGIHRMVQRTPRLKIKPDLFLSNRSDESWQKHGGFLPIYEKENAFDYLKDYDQIAIIDADIYIRKDAENVFDHFGVDHAFGAVCEREMPITPEYLAKIQNYSAMQYGALDMRDDLDFKKNQKGFEFFNMGMMLINSEKFKPYLKGQTAKQFLNRSEFMDFINGKGAWKWSTDQTLLNYFIKKYNVPTKHMHFRWNGLYTANTHLHQCDFIHFFLKDKLPNRGENIGELMKEMQ